MTKCYYMLGGDKMYLKNKLVRINLRVSPEEAEYIYHIADILGCTVSGAIRTIINSYRGELENENQQININD